MKNNGRCGRHSFTIAGLLLVAATGCISPTRSGWRAYDGGDYATALREWTPLAEQGDADAQFLVGVMHEDGQGVPVDHDAAAWWYRLAAEQGYAAAQNNLGALYFSGKGVERSTEEAATWFGRAAEQGFASAQNNLGVMHMFGQAVPRDPGKATELLQLAATQGDVKARTTVTSR